MSEGQHQVRGGLLLTGGIALGLLAVLAAGILLLRTAPDHPRSVPVADGTSSASAVADARAAVASTAPDDPGPLTQTDVPTVLGPTPRHPVTPTPLQLSSAATSATAGPPPTTRATVRQPRVRPTTRAPAPVAARPTPSHPPRPSPSPRPSRPPSSSPPPPPSPSPTCRPHGGPPDPGHRLPHCHH